MRKLFLLLLMTCIILSCNTKDKPQKNIIPTLTFTVNQQLIGDSIQIDDEGLKIKVPRNWKPISAAQLH